MQLLELPPTLGHWIRECFFSKWWQDSDCESLIFFGISHGHTAWLRYEISLPFVIWFVFNTTNNWIEHEMSKENFYIWWKYNYERFHVNYCEVMRTFPWWHENVQAELLIALYMLRPDSSRTLWNFLTGVVRSFGSMRIVILDFSWWYCMGTTKDNIVTQKMTLFLIKGDFLAQKMTLLIPGTAVTSASPSVKLYAGPL